MSRSELRTWFKLAIEAARFEALRFFDALEEATTPKSVPVEKKPAHHRCPTCASITRKAANHV